MIENLTPEQKVIHDECHKCYGELLVLEKKFLELQAEYNAKKTEYEQYLFQVNQMLLGQ